MAFPLRSLLFFSSILAIALSYRQQLSVHETATDAEQGNVHIFQRQTPELPISFRGMKRYCFQGLFILYLKPHYQQHQSAQGSVYTCGTLEIPGIQSFRYVGASETTEDAVSLYEGISQTGEEVFVPRSPYGGIDLNIQSLGLTGKSAWTLFEGRNFNGKSACVPAPTASWGVAFYHSLSSLNMTTVGSLFKGCPNLLSRGYLDAVRAEWSVIQNNSTK